MPLGQKCFACAVFSVKVWCQERDLHRVRSERAKAAHAKKKLTHVDTSPSRKIPKGKPARKRTRMPKPVRTT